MSKEFEKKFWERFFRPTSDVGTHIFGQAKMFGTKKLVDQFLGEIRIWDQLFRAHPIFRSVEKLIYKSSWWTTTSAALLLPLYVNVQAIYFGCYKDRVLSGPTASIIRYL